MTMPFCWPWRRGNARAEGACISLETTSGKKTLDDYRDRPWFSPSSPSVHRRLNQRDVGVPRPASKFADNNAQVLGVSMDDLETQKRFAQS